MNDNTDAVRDIIPARLAIKALRDSGYKNTAYALSELIDNSAQAEATGIEVYCVETQQLVRDRERRKLDQVAVLDNGMGMTPDTLSLALQFGNGTRLSDRSGIGRFGMGLPNSSISQCRKVEIWTWQAGPDNAIYSYLDVPEIEEGVMRSVPNPVHMPVPEQFLRHSQIVGTCGTLVLWSQLDRQRLTWSGSKALLKHTENLVGRIHRRFIGDSSLDIRLISLYDDEFEDHRQVRINDPLYLCTPSSTPAPYDKQPMFEKWGEGIEEFEFNYDEQIHNIQIRMSLASPDTVPADNSDRGNKLYGKHAAKNVGVSIVRAGRELDLDASWGGQYDTTDRWWGIEVEFPPALDELFGVTINKQAATNFSAMSTFDISSEQEQGETASECCSRLCEAHDARGYLWEITHHIRTQISEMKKQLRKQTIGSRVTGRRHDQTSIEDTATRKFVERAAKHPTKFDQIPFKEEDRQQLVTDLVGDKGYTDKDANDIGDAVMAKGRKVVFVCKAIDSPTFFSVENKHGGLTTIVFNESHPFFEQLVAVLNEDEAEDLSLDELADRLRKHRDAVKLLFSAWARYELEATSPEKSFPELRHEWGRMAKTFLRKE